VRSNWLVLRVLLMVLCVLSLGTAHAQSTNSGDIRGTVTDSTGALIPGVTVTVVNNDTGITKVLTTNKDGLYDTSSIVIGTYSVTFEKAGFAKFERTAITLEVGTSTVNATLKVGSTSDQVVVDTDNIPLLSTESGEQSTTLEAKTMAALPQVTQDWENFIILLPGAAGAATAQQGSGTAAANPGQVAAVNGNLPYSNILADGASTTLSMSQNANPAVFETVAELQVTTSAFSAQYGIGGLVINQITKGGTSRFHGAGYEYLQNSFLNSFPYEFGADPKLIGPVPFLRYNNFGGNIGGPVAVPLWNLRKKAFFFFNYDQIVNHGASSSATQTVPTTGVLGGDFTGQRTIYDPTTQTIAIDSAGNPYPVRKSFQDEYGSNAIPTSMFDPVAAKFQQFYPTPSNHIAGGSFLPGTVNTSGLLQNNWYSQVPASNPFRRYFGRLDYDITPSNRITMSDTQSDTPVQSFSNVTSCPIGCESQDVDNNNAQITDVWNISSRTINEARMGYTWQGNFFADLSLDQGYAAKLGWQFAKADDIPSIQFTNTYPYAWIEPATNAIYKEHVFDPSDVVTMIRGKHVLHFGGEFLIYRDDSTNWGNINAGTLQFSGQYTQHWSLNSAGVASPDNATTGLEYADFLLGQAQQWNAGVTPEYGARLKSPQVFIQDDFKVRPNLTINLGLRYQINHGWSEVHGNADSFDPTVMNPATATLGATWYQSTGANGRHSVQADVYNTFLPRVGFSWSMDPNTTLRGGFGIYSYAWSLDNYGSGMGSPFGSSGNQADQTNGITPEAILGGSGSNLKYTAASTDPARFNGQNVGYNQFHTPVAKIYQWNLATQHMIGGNLVVELAYVASHGFDLTFPTDLNQIPEAHLSSNDVALGFRPYSQYASIAGNTYNAISNYNSLQASITKRLTHGVSFSANYVWSHFLDDQDSSGWGSREGPQPYSLGNDPSSNYSNSNFDVRNAFKGYAIYELPFGRGKQFLNNNSFLDALIGGWQASGTLVLSSGNPFTVYGTQSTYAQAGSAFPNWNPGVNPKPQHRDYNEWFNPAAFTVPANGTFGNVRRNSLYGPGIDNVTLSGSKTFSLPWEGIKLLIRADAYNAFNHPSFGPPGQSGQTLAAPGGASVGTPYVGPTSGQITTLEVGARNVQLGARVSF
jgi:Carboxypeptidase regulatory-like domain/TonB dependent receptor